MHTASSAPPVPPEVVVCGESMVLLLAEPGVPLEHAAVFRRAVAGAESNVATGLARLGHSVRWLGRVGDDPAGRTVLAALRAEGIDTSYATVDPAAPTGLLMRDSHPARPVDVQYHRAGSAASRLAAPQLHGAMLAGARLLHLTGITPMLSDAAHDAVRRLLELARDAGVTVSFDPNVRRKLGPPERWRTVVGPLLEQAAIVLAGEDELELLGYGGAAAGALLDGAGDGRGRAHTVVVKHRDKSASCLTAHGAGPRRTAFRVPVTDPVGAGDAFAAGFLSGLLRGAPHEEALTGGAAVAALVVQCANDTDGLPDRAGLARALAAFEGAADAVHR